MTPAAATRPAPVGVLVATTETLAGFPVRCVLGTVVGSVPVERNKFANGMKALPGETIDRIRTLVRDRHAAMDQMIERAARLGANAVLGMRFDHREVSGAWMEVCAYGTAVVVDTSRAG